MKKIFFLFVLILSSSTILAQTSKKTTGPEVKNAKIWEQKKTPTIVLVNSFEKTKLVGARFKNQKIWDKELSENKITLKIDKNKKRLQGPKAKNFKPWMK